MAMETPRNLAADTVNSALPQLDSFGHVKPYERDKAKALIDETLIAEIGGPFTMKVTGFFIALKVYVRPDELKEIERADGTKVTFHLPYQATQQDKYQAASALVLGVGPQAYKGKNADGSDKFPEGPWCSVGDWVMIPRYECALFMFNGPNGKSFPFGILPDDRIMGVIQDPRDVTAVHLKDQM